MKPNTKLQKEVFKYHKQLRPINSYVKKWAESKFKAYGLIKYKKVYCSECNSKIDYNETLCSNCNATLEIVDKTNYNEDLLFNIITTHKDYQVIRVLLSKKFVRTNLKPHLIHVEVAQYWINKDGTITMFSKTLNGYNYNIYNWNLGSEIRLIDTRSSLMKIYLKPFAIYPKIKVIDNVIRNGYNNEFHFITPATFFNLILKNPKAETLLKTKQYQLLNYMDSYPQAIIKYWSSIKIAIRNGYIVTDPSTWFDYLDDLEYFELDLRSPKYICVVDQQKEHQRYTKKRNAIAQREVFENQKAELKEDNKKYVKKMKPYFNLVFRNENIIIEPLRSVHDFLREGVALNHCVYTGGYYKRNSLILSAKVNGKRTETIEISLDTFKIQQTRGAKNNKTIYHNDIVELMNNNINQLKQIAHE